MARNVTYDTDALLASAKETFLLHGPSASTQLLAKNAGVSEGTLFKRFGNKKKLFLESMQLIPLDCESWYARLLERAAVMPLEELLVEAGIGLQEHFARNLPRIQALMAYPDLNAADHRSVMGDTNPFPLAVRRRFQALFDQQIEAGAIPSQDTYALAALFAGAITNDAHLRIILEVRDEETDPHSFVRRIAKTFTALILSA